MKKIIGILLSCFIIITVAPIYSSAAMRLISEPNINHSPNTAIVYQDNDIIIECTLNIGQTVNTGIQPFATNQTKTASKTYSIKSSQGKIIGTYTLTGTFSYNGTTSSCTNASCSTSIKDKTWKFTFKTAGKTGNKATGAFTIECSASGQTISDSLSITCSKNGDIS